MVNGERYYVSYEGLTNICSLCGLYGHLVHTCPKRALEKGDEKAAEVPIPAVRAVTSGIPPTNDGFTEVRRRGRAPAPPAKSPAANVAFAAGSSGPNLGRNLQEIPENIMVSNKFGGLSEDMVSTEMRKVAISSAGNKENSLMINQSGKGKGIAINKEITGSGIAGKSQNGTKMSNQNSRAYGIRPIKPNENAGQKAKQVRINKPTRGLVFGPTRGEFELTRSGKRIRVESNSAGRPGGIFGSLGERNMIVPRVGNQLTTELEGEVTIVDSNDTSSEMVVVSGEPVAETGGSPT